MNQGNYPIRDSGQTHPVRVQPPHDYDGIGQALRSAYRDDCEPSDQMASALRDLERLD